MNRYNTASNLCTGVKKAPDPGSATLISISGLLVTYRYLRVRYLGKKSVLRDGNQPAAAVRRQGGEAVVWLRPAQPAHAAPAGRLTRRQRAPAFATPGRFQGPVAGMRDHGFQGPSPCPAVPGRNRFRDCCTTVAQTSRFRDHGTRRTRRKQLRNKAVVTRRNRF